MPDFGLRHGSPSTHGYTPNHSYCPAHGTPQLAATPSRSTFHHCPAIRYRMVTPTWSLTTIRNLSAKRMARLHHPLALVHQAWLAGDFDIMLNLATYLFLKVPCLNIKALTLAISHPPKLQQTIQLNHTFLRPAVHLVGPLGRIYDHRTQK